MITGERTYHRRKLFSDGLHIGIPGIAKMAAVRMGTVVQDKR
jgi:hypothetical protein